MPNFALESLRPFLGPPGLAPGPDGKTANARAQDQLIENIVHLTGASQVIRLRKTYSFSLSRQILSETQRTYDVVKVWNEDDEDQNVKIEVPTKKKVVDGKGQSGDVNMAKPQDSDNSEVIDRDRVRANPVQPRVINVETSGAGAP